MSILTTISPIISPAAVIGAGTVSASLAPAMAGTMVVAATPAPDRSESRYIAPASSLKGQLRALWGSPRLVNKNLVRMPYHEAEDDDPDYRYINMPTSTSQLPLTQKMVKAIIRDKSQQRGVKIEDLDVIVAFHGGNIMEVLMWLETGANVIAYDTSILAGLKLRRRLKKHGFSKLPANLRIRNPLWWIQKGDIVTACHPNISILNPIGNNIKKITRYGRSDATYIVQADYYKYYIDPFVNDPSFDVLLKSGVGVGHYFFPSELVTAKRYTHLLIARQLT